jgi:hypothetical protein
MLFPRTVFVSVDSRDTRQLIERYYYLRTVLLLENGPTKHRPRALFRLKFVTRYKAVRRLSLKCLSVFYIRVRESIQGLSHLSQNGKCATS